MLSVNEKQLLLKNNIKISSKATKKNCLTEFISLLQLVSVSKLFTYTSKYACGSRARRLSNIFMYISSTVYSCTLYYIHFLKTSTEEF